MRLRTPSVAACTAEYLHRTRVDQFCGPKHLDLALLYGYWPHTSADQIQVA